MCLGRRCWSNQKRKCPAVFTLYPPFTLCYIVDLEVGRTASIVGFSKVRGVTDIVIKWTPLSMDVFWTSAETHWAAVDINNWPSWGHSFLFFVCVLAVAYYHLLYWTVNKSVTNVKAAQQGKRVTVWKNCAWCENSQTVSHVNTGFPKRSQSEILTITSSCRALHGKTTQNGKDKFILGAAKLFLITGFATLSRNTQLEKWRSQQTACRVSESQPLTGPAAPWYIQPEWGSAAPAGSCAAATAPSRPLAPPVGDLFPVGFYLGCPEDLSRPPPGTAVAVIPAEAPQDCSHQ